MSRGHFSAAEGDPLPRFDHQYQGGCPRPDLGLVAMPRHGKGVTWSRAGRTAAGKARSCGAPSGWGSSADAAGEDHTVQVAAVAKHIAARPASGGSRTPSIAVRCQVNLLAPPRWARAAAAGIGGRRGRVGHCLSSRHAPCVCSGPRHRHGWAQTSPLLGKFHYTGPPKEVPK